MKLTAEPRSDQWNADDFVGGPRTFTIAGVKPGKAEQKYDVELVEGEGRVWRPPLTMLRLLIAAWGDEAEQWKGRKVTLYRDETVRFGKDQVGGIRVSHLSHIDSPFQIALTKSRGRRGLVSVQPLPDTPVGRDDAVAQFALETASLQELQEAWRTADPDTKKLIEARAAELKAGDAA